MTRHAIVVYVCPPAALLAAAGGVAYGSAGIDAPPVFAAWALASANFALAMGGMIRAQDAEPTLSMLLVFGGGAVRMLLMVGAIFIVMKTLAEWFVPFCITLLACFVSYLCIEVWEVYRRGLLERR